MDPATLLVLIAVSGLAAGIVSGLFGVGGGILMVPAVLYLVPGTDFHLAKAASLVVISVSSILGVYTHYRHHSVEWRTGLLLSIGGVAGSIVSVLAVERIEEGLLRLAFGVLLAVTGLRLAFGAQPKPRDLKPATRTSFMLGLGLVAGLLAGAFGIGGGIFTVPGMIFVGLGVHLAVGTSLVSVLSNSIVSTGTHLAVGYGTNLLALGIPLAIGAVPGVRLGSKLAHKLKAERLRKSFGVFLVLIGAMMVLQRLL